MNRWWLVCLALATGCGGGASSTPTAPAAPLVTRITIAGSELLLVGKTETFTAASDVGNIAVPHWTSDAPTVATIDLSGHVTAVGIGTATISADASGIRGTKLIRTLPNFAGSWKGGYQQIGCEADGEFVHLQPCDSYWDFASGTTKLTLTQDGATVSGALELGPYAVSGSISPRRHLVVERHADRHVHAPTTKCALRIATRRRDDWLVRGTHDECDRLAANAQRAARHDPQERTVVARAK